MDIFFAFVTLLNASLLIAGGYYVWKAPEKVQLLIEEAVRKQDDRLRKRYGAANDGKQAGEAAAQEAANVEVNRSTARPAAGQSRRRRVNTNSDS